MSDTEGRRALETKKEDFKAKLYTFYAGFFLRKLLQHSCEPLPHQKLNRQFISNEKIKEFIHGLQRKRESKNLPPENVVRIHNTYTN